MSVVDRDPIRVVVAENSHVIREFLVETLAGDVNVELTAGCSSSRELRRAMALQRPDVVVTDIRICPERRDAGIRIARRLQVTDPDIGVVVLSQSAEPAYAVAMLESSTARAYLLKERIRGKGELLAAVEAVARGDTRIDREIVDALIETGSRTTGSPLSSLDPARRKLLALIAQGNSCAAIADSLGRAARAAEEDIEAIFRDLNLPEPASPCRRARAVLLFLAQEGAGTAEGGDLQRLRTAADGR